MLSRQKQLIETLQRTRSFLTSRRLAEATPVWDAMVHDFCAMVDDVLHWTGEQVAGERLARAGTGALRAAVHALRELHVRPITRVAYALRYDTPDLAIRLRMPRRRLPVTKLLAECDAISRIAGNNRGLLVSNGRPTDFLEQLDAAIARVRECVRRRDRAKSRQVGATAALEDSIRRARSRMLIFDAQIPLIFRDDADALGHWEVMKRVHRLPSYANGGAGGNGAADTAGSDAGVTPPVLPLFSRAA